MHQHYMHQCKRHSLLLLRRVIFVLLDCLEGFSYIIVSF